MWRFLIAGPDLVETNFSNLLGNDLNPIVAKYFGRKRCRSLHSGFGFVLLANLRLDMSSGF